MKRILLLLILGTVTWFPACDLLHQEEETEIPSEMPENLWNTIWPVTTKGYYEVTYRGSGSVPAMTAQVVMMIMKTTVTTMGRVRI